jgi:GNAT superfamily N-acetyltransferase
MGVLRIELLGDHVDLVPTVAAWHWEEWGRSYPEASLAGWTEGLAGRARRDGLPTWVAFSGDEPVGSVSLVDHDMDVHLDLTPWLAGLYVVPSHRGRGIGSALMRACERAARDSGVAILYLYTDPATAAGLYAPHGWSTLSEERYRGELTVVMRKELR